MIVAYKGQQDDIGEKVTVLLYTYAYSQAMYGHNRNKDAKQGLMLSFVPINKRAE